MKFPGKLALAAVAYITIHAPHSPALANSDPFRNVSYHNQECLIQKADDARLYDDTFSNPMLEEVILTAGIKRSYPRMPHPQIESQYTNQPCIEELLILEILDYLRPFFDLIRDYFKKF